MTSGWWRALAGEPGPDAAREASLRAFRVVLLAHGATRSWLWMHFDEGLAGASSPMLAAAALGLSLSLGLACFRSTEAASARLALPILGLQLLWTFPLSDNHFVLELYGVALLSVLGPPGRPDEARWVIAGLRLLVAGVLLMAGLQKVMHGYYFGGEFLAFMIGRGDRFGTFFELLLPSAEVMRLQAYDPLVSGQGPYRVASLPFVLASNGVWLAEIGLGALLLWRRSWPAAPLAAIALVVVLQLAAREVGFASLFVVWLLLFTEAGVRRAAPAFLCFYAYVLCAAMGWLPGGSWIEAGSL